MIERWADPPYTPIVPILEPFPHTTPLELAFPPKIRDWWRVVGENKCQTHLYSEEKGWYICGSTRDIEVDHIDPESTQLIEGRDPNNSVGLPRCHSHHAGRGLVYEKDGPRIAHYGEQEWSRHPDMGFALAQYRKGDKEAFKKAAQKHVDLAKLGIPIANSSPEVDAFEREYMLSLERKYIEASHLKRPSVKPHPKFNK